MAPQDSAPRAATTRTRPLPKGAGAGPHLALVAVQLMFGTWPIFGKIALRTLPSTGIVAVRVAGGALAFALLQRLTRHVPIRQRSDYALLFLYSLLGVVVNQLLFTKGLALSTAVNATLIGTAIPVFTLLVSILLGRERASLGKALGMTLAAAGVVFLVNPFEADLSGGRAVGNLLIVANTLCYGAYIAVSQDIIKRYGALTVIAWLFGLGSIVAVPFGAVQMFAAPPADLTWQVWLVMVYIVLVPTVGAYYLNAWALARVSPSTVAVYIYLQPLIASTLAPLVLGDEERWNWRTAAAAALIFAGVAVVTLGARGPAADEVSERPEAMGH
ncbi:MAG TPA: DMT family transporter [Pyrinomonadaceae bacterium]|nr:DMT family transporter [Pyrinomonadaceae bacterium]